MFFEPLFDPVEHEPNPLWPVAWFFVVLAVGIVFVAWRTAYGCADLLVEAWGWWDRACDPPCLPEQEDGE